MIRAALIFLCVASVVPVTHAAVIDHARLLDAIRQVEEWDGRDGSAGERGPWQITAAVWKKHCPAWSFDRARATRYARVCAERHLEWLAAGLRRHGIEPTPYALALAWNAGLTGATTGRAPVRAYEYARRVENLYQAKP